MGVTYATPNDYFQSTGMPIADWPTEDDAEFVRIDALLKKSSDTIRRMTRLARLTYGVDGFPHDANIRQGFIDATCAQAAWFEEAGDTTGFAAGYDNVSMIGVSFGRNAGTASGKPSSRESRYSPEAQDILVTLGIFGTRPSHPGV